MGFIDFFKKLPWWIQIPGKAILGLCGGYVSNNPQIFPRWAVLIGALIALLVVLAFIWHALNTWREHKGKKRLQLDPNVIVIVCLTGALGATIWQWFRIRPIDPQIAHLGQVNLSQQHTETGNPLWDQINVFLAKRGKSASPSTTSNLPNTFAMGDAADGKGPYITYWGTDLGPWPTIEDGFNGNELRDLPKKVPKFSTQFDRENFRSEVSALQTILHKKMGTIIRLSQSLGPISPTPEHRVEFQEKLSQIAVIYNEVDGLLFIRGSTGNGSFFDSATYKDLLMGALPDDWQTQWVSYSITRSNLVKALALMQGAERHPEDTDLLALAKTNMGAPKDQFLQQTGKLQEWLDRADKRIALLISAI